MWIRQWYYLAGNYSPISLGQTCKSEIHLFFSIGYQNDNTIGAHIPYCLKILSLGEKSVQWVHLLLFGQIYSKGLGY